MTKGRLLLVMLALTGLALLGFTYFHTNYHYIENAVWRGLQGDAKKDPYYLTEAFLKRKGYEVTRQKNHAQFTASDLQHIDTLFFTNDAHTLSEEQVSAVIHWVENGGNVVIFAGKASYETDENARPASDAELEKRKTRNRHLLFSRTGIAVVACEGDNCSCPDFSSCSSIDDMLSSEPLPPELEAVIGTDEDKETQTVEEKIENLFKPYKGDYATTFRLGGKPITLDTYRADWLYAHEDGKAKQRHVQVARCYGDIFSVFDVGSGTITLYNSTPEYFGHFLYYDNIWDDGNASFLDALLQVGSGKRILWFENSLYPSIWAFIWQYAGFALVVGILLLLAWIWKHSRRFGSLIVEDERKGLTLERHLRATGLFYYQNEQANLLLQNCYEQLDKKVARRIVNHHKLKYTELAEKIAELTGFSQAKIQHVLAKRFPQTDGEFTQMIHYINEIQKRL